MVMGNDYTSLYVVNPNKHNGYEVSLSLVAMFTMGVSDRDGFRWGGGVTVSKSWSDFKVMLGADSFGAKQGFGLGTTFAGIVYDDGRYGVSYYVNRYYQGDKQTSGILGLHLGDFGVRFEDDILALPFTGFVIHDRYRTAALEVRYRHFLVGTNVYTNEVNGLIDVSGKNPKGVYASGRQISSPVYVGYSNKNLIFRYGMNAGLGGYVGQNWWHQKLFGTSDFKGDVSKSHFLQFGVDKPYTLY